MRQLWATGWMHNRARLLAGSFLVKDLLQPWQQGAAWFWDTLADADLANNTLGWQWVSGCGADAAPYFRVFNPVTQGRRFDPDGAYVRRWVPELAGLDAGPHPRSVAGAGRRSGGGRRDARRDVSADRSWITARRACGRSPPTSASGPAERPAPARGRAAEAHAPLSSAGASAQRHDLRHRPSVARRP